MTANLPNPKDILHRLGGVVNVAKHLHISHGAVSQWTYIPMDHVPALVQLSRDRGDPIEAKEMRPDKPWAAICHCEHDKFLD